MKTEKRNSEQLLARLAGAALVLGMGCNGVNWGQDGSGGEGGGTGDQDPMPGHLVTCCYQGAFNLGAKSGYGCLKDQHRECVDPNDVDINDAEALAAFCHIKCTPPWPAGAPNPWPAGVLDVPPWDFFQIHTQSTEDLNPPDFPDTFDACWGMPVTTAVQLPASHIKPDGYNQCQPASPHPYRENGIEVPPTHETDFTSSSSGNDVEIWIANNQLTPASYNLNVKYSIDQWEWVEGNKYTARVIISHLELTFGNMTFDGYAVNSVRLALNQRVAAEEQPFECDTNGCVGVFEFSEDEGNPIAANLFWTQIQRGTSNVAHGKLPLGNHDEALGGVEALVGILDLTGGSSTSTLRLIGYGADSFGGDFASLDFDLLGQANYLIVPTFAP